MGGGVAAISGTEPQSDIRAFIAVYALARRSLGWVELPVRDVPVVREASLCAHQGGHRRLPISTPFILIETFVRLVWRSDGLPVLERDTVALLHYLRTTRNGSAHPPARSAGTLKEDGTARDIARIAVRTANRLWQRAANVQEELVSTAIDRSR